MGKYVYGPVPSRRLGRSLGVDLVPMKTCSFNCVYCQLGPTPATTLERAEYAPVDEVVAEVRARLDEPAVAHAHGPSADYVTLGGSGEPTLHSSFGIVAQRIREVTDVPIALLTNGSLFYLPEVREACSAIDVVIPNLDAGDEETFQRINRPHEGLTLEKVVRGLAALREEFAGRIWLEVFLLEGLNTSEGAVEKLRAQIARIRPDRIQLNTAVRPAAEAFVRAVSAQRLEEIRAMLGPNAEAIADVEEMHEAGALEATAQDVVELLRRRPCTLEDIAAGLAIHRNEAIKYVRELLEAGRISERREGGRLFYRAR